MSKDVSADRAREIVAVSEKAGSALGVLGEAVRKIENAELRQQILQRVGEMMADLYTEVMRPMIRRYLDLDPDKGM